MNLSDGLWSYQPAKRRREDKDNLGRGVSLSDGIGMRMPLDQPLEKDSVGRGESDGLGMEMLATRIEMPALTIPRLPKSERVVAAAYRKPPSRAEPMCFSHCSVPIRGKRADMSCIPPVNVPPKSVIDIPRKMMNK